MKRATKYNPHGSTGDSGRSTLRVRYFALLIALLVLSLLASIYGVFPTIFLYGVIIAEGMGVSAWILSKLRAESDTIRLIRTSPSDRRYHNESNRAESLFLNVKLAARRGSSYSGYFKGEVARALENILEVSPSKEALMKKNEYKALLHPRERDHEKENLSKAGYLSSLERLVSELEGS